MKILFYWLKGVLGHILEKVKKYQRSLWTTNPCRRWWRTKFILYICSNRHLLNILHLDLRLGIWDQAEHYCKLNVQIASCLYSTVQLINIGRQPSLSRGSIDYFSKSHTNRGKANVQDLSSGPSYKMVRHLLPTPGEQQARIEQEFRRSVLS